MSRQLFTVPGMIAVVIALALIATACGSSGGSDESAADVDSTSSDEAVSAEEGDTAETGTETDSDDAEAAEEPADAGPLPTPVEPVFDGPPVDVADLDVPRGESIDYGTPPEFETGDLSQEVLDALEVTFGANLTDGEGRFEEAEFAALDVLVDSGDTRLAWLMSDLMRFTGGEIFDKANSVATRLMGVEFGQTGSWNSVTNRLIAWDVPAPPNYVEWKGNLFTLVLDEWSPFFETESAVDWRFVSWGGVRIDDRPFDQTDEPCNCIPAADNPTVTNVADADWPDETVIFGVDINGERRAYPRQIMEVREMVNDTLGGRDIGMPYCTLCGAAQVYFTDDLPAGIERPVLRTSGLLSRSNKFMYDLTTFSAMDTFTGEALSGPLWEQGIVLEQASVITTTWGQWKATFPDTTILTEDLSLGRNPDFRSNRDANGPIFPVGDVDPRLPIQEDVLGVIAPDGTPTAFHIESAITVLRSGADVIVNDIVLEWTGGGVRAFDTDGNDLGTHQAFWFAWSQFHPDTELWPPST